MSNFFAVLATIVLGTLVLGPPIAGVYHLYIGFKIRNQTQSRPDIIDRWAGNTSLQEAGQRHIRLGIMYSSLIPGLIIVYLLLAWIFL